MFAKSLAARYDPRQSIWLAGRSFPLPIRIFPHLIDDV
jgi:hypothetical protein